MDQNETAAEGISQEASAAPEANPIQPLETIQTDIAKMLRDSELSAKDLKIAEAMRAKGEAVAPKPGTLPPAPVPGQYAQHSVHLDPSALVLPNKEVHSPLNAERIGADVLVKQEQGATLPKNEAPLPPIPAPPKPKSAIPPMETLQGDVQSYIKENRVSAVTVAAAEQQRRADANEPIRMEQARSIISKTALLIGGIVLLVASLGALGYVYYIRAPLPPAQNPTAPFIVVDQTTPVAMSARDARASMMQALVDAKNSSTLSLGLVAELVPTNNADKTALTAQDFFATFTPNMPAQLLRTLQPNFLVGVHSFAGNKTFIMLSVDSYEQGYAGMLAWEKTMPSDLSPLFAYSPATAPTTQTGSSTPAVQVLATGFSDTIVENHDVRIITGSGDPILWTFLSRTTILIASDPNTIKEIISRQKTAPTITIPGR